jgi:hypothetical protein
MSEKLKQRLVGIFLIVGGAGYTVYEWRDALASGTYSPKAAFLFPVFMMLGLAVLLFPITKEEMLANYGVERPSSLRHYSWGQKVLFLLAIAAGALNWAAMSGKLSL